MPISPVGGSGPSYMPEPLKGPEDRQVSLPSPDREQQIAQVLDRLMQINNELDKVSAKIIEIGHRLSALGFDNRNTPEYRDLAAQRQELLKESRKLTIDQQNTLRELSELMK